MRRRAAVVVALAVAVLACVLTAAGANGAEPGGSAAAARHLSQCLQTTNRLSVLMLIDESGSLKTTDPNDQRVDGVRAALTGLSRLASTPVNGKVPSVDVQFLGFAGTVRPDVSGNRSESRWRKVNESTLDSLLAEAGTYEKQDFRSDTDYGTALLAAQRVLAQRAAVETRTGQPRPCQALVWFTDGRYALQDRTHGAVGRLPHTVPYADGVQLDRKGGGLKAASAGKKFLCNRLMDQLADDDVVKFTVALSQILSPSDSAFLRRLTTGSGGGGRCGTKLSEKTGQYLGVEDGGDLFFGFANLFAGGTGGPPVVVCEQTRCTGGFTAESGMGRFLIHAETGSQGVDIDLRGPTGPVKRLHADVGRTERFSLAGADVIVRWVSPRAVEIEGTFAPNSDAWHGKWSFTFVRRGAPGPGKVTLPSYTIQLFADVAPILLGRPTVVRGEENVFRLGLARSNGDRVTSGPLVRRSALKAVLSDPKGREIPAKIDGPSASGEFTVSVPVPLNLTASTVFLDVDASFKTGTDVRMVPVHRSFELRSLLSKGSGYPLLDPAKLHLPSVEGTASTTGTLTVTGSPAGGGCVWIGNAPVQGPEEAGELVPTFSPDATAPSRCLRVKRGEERKLKVTFKPSHQGTGHVSTTLPVHLQSDTVKGEPVTDVPADFEMVRTPDVTTQIVIVVALMLGGILLPLLLLHLLNWWGARFAEPERVRALVQDVVVRPGEDVKTPEGKAPDTRYEQFSRLPEVAKVDAGRRKIELDEITLRTRASGSLRERNLNPFTGPHARIDAAGPYVVVGGEGGGRSRRWDDVGRDVPLALAGTWIFWVTSADDSWVAEPTTLSDNGPREITGQLVLFIQDNDRGQEQAISLLSDADASLKSRAWPSAAELRPVQESDTEGFLTRTRERISERLPSRDRASGEDEDWGDVELDDVSESAAAPQQAPEDEGW